MRKKLEANLNVYNVRKKIINKKNKRPYSSPKKSWTIPVYYIWRLLRYDLGADISYPIITQGMLVNHPQEAETVAILAEIEMDYPELEGYNDIRRII